MRVYKGRGVQRCALPICPTTHLRARSRAKMRRGPSRGSRHGARGWAARKPSTSLRADRKSVAAGKSEDLGGRRLILKKYVDTLLRERSVDTSRWCATLTG